MDRIQSKERVMNNPLVKYDGDYGSIYTVSKDGSRNTTITNFVCHGRVMERGDRHEYLDDVYYITRMSAFIYYHCIIEEEDV